MQPSMRLAIWPPPRRPLTVWSYLTPVLFLLGFPALCFALEWTDTVVFTRLWPFWFLLLTPWFWRMHTGGYSGLSPTRAQIALVTRLLLLCLFVGLLAEPRSVRKDERLAVMFAVDQSASIVPQSTNQALEFVTNTYQKKPEKDEAGLLFFGRNAAVELPPSPSLTYENQIVSVHIERDGTDLAKALALSAAMLPPGRQSRIVLMSDGVATQGALSSVLDDLKARKIPVDILPIDYQFDREVWLERLDLPRFVKVGQPFDASVVLSSLTAGDGTLVLEENGRVIARQKVSFHSGKNRFSLPVKLDRTGYYEYSARIELGEGQDSWKHNNQAISFLYLKGEGSVLLVTDETDSGNPQDWQELERAIRTGQRKVERISSFDLPRNSLALLPYDCVVFVNVGRDLFDEAQLQAVHDAVKNQGSGFLMVGGANSFGPGGYQRTVIEKCLPVSMDITKRKFMPKGALAIVLHSCEFPDGNTWAKRITKQAIKVLSAKDDVGVLVYDFQGRESWLFPLMPAENYEEMSVLITNAQIGDMPDFQTTMELGFAGLKANNASAKHMIIISDGDPSPPTPFLLQKFRSQKIHISTIAMNPHGPNCLNMIAKATGGKFYDQPKPEELPRIFIKEAKTLRRSAVQNITFSPEFTNPSQILKGIQSMPKLHGYVWTTPKETSTTILDGPAKDEPDPLLAHWRYGVGASAAFTSDLSPNWAKDWMSWSMYSAFVRQLITEISRAETQSNVQVRSYATSGQGHIIVEDFGKDASFLNVAANVEGPNGTAQQVTLKQVAPNRYEGNFPLQGKGRYQVTALGMGADGKQKVRSHGGFVVSYSEEFLRFRADPVVLDRIRERTGGRLLDGTETGDEIFQVDRQPRLSSRSIIDLLLILLACLIPLDVAFRRVQMDWATFKSWFGFGRAERTETLSTLLAMKERMSGPSQDAQDDTERQVPEVVTRDKTGQPTTRSSSATTAAAPKTESAPRPSGTTTSRLLEAKRRAQQKKDQ